MCSVIEVGSARSRVSICSSDLPSVDLPRAAATCGKCLQNSSAGGSVPSAVGASECKSLSCENEESWSQCVSLRSAWWLEEQLEPDLSWPDGRDWGQHCGANVKDKGLREVLGGHCSVQPRRLRVWGRSRELPVVP